MPLKIYGGTPRKLRFLTKDEFYRLDEIAVKGCKIRYKLNTHSRLVRVIRDAKLFKENELIGATDTVAGLEATKVKYPDGRGTVKGAILGGDCTGSRRNWQLSPELRPKLAQSFNLQFKGISVTIPDRDEYERGLLSSLNEQMPEEEVFREERNMFGVKKMLKQNVSTVSNKARAKIIQRRLKIGVHNGRTLCSDSWTEIEVEESENDDDELVDLAKKQVVSNYPKHELMAVVIILEYVIRPAKSSVKSNTEAMRKGRDSTAENFTIVVGCQVYIPYDGKRLRLRNEPKETERSQNFVGLSLFCDQRCRAFTNDYVYNPREEVDPDDEEDAGKVIKFSLKCTDRKGREQPDETPLNDEDESDVEADLSDADTEATWASDSDKSAATSKFSSEEEEEDSSSEEEEDSSEEDRQSDEYDEKSAKSPRLKKSRKKPKDKRKEKKRKKKRSKKKRKKKSFSDEDSDLESSIVSGDSFSNFLVLRTGAHGGRRSQSRFRKPKKSRGGVVGGRHRYSADDANALESIHEEEWEGWRQGIHVPKDRKNVSGAALTAPMHFSSSYDNLHASGGGGAQFAHASDYSAGALAVGAAGTAPLSSAMSRAARTRLGRHGFFEKVLENYNDVGQEDPSTSYNVDKELEDHKLRHEITVQFAAFNATEKSAPLPNSVYFTFQFYDKEPTRTDRLVLRKSSRSDDDDHTVSRVLCREKVGKGNNEFSPSRTLKFTFDLSMVGLSEAKNFASYLKSKSLYVDVWDGDALMHYGTMAIPLKRLMRQGRSTSKLARVYDVIRPRGLAEEGGPLGVRPGAIGGGPVIGQVQMLMANYGEAGKGGDVVGAGIESEFEVESSRPSAELNWRSNTLSKSLNAVSRPSTPGGRAKHKVRARPLSESNKDLKKMIKSFGIADGNLGASKGSSSATRGGDDIDTISYEELMNLCKRFRSSTKGRIDYKRGGLLELLDVPDVARLEKRLVRLLTLAEDRGTSLEETFNFLDTDNDKEMTASDLEEGLKSLKAFEGMRRDEISLLVSRFPRNSDGMVSLTEFIAFVRERQPKSPEEDKLRKILAKAEAMGKSVEDIFGFFDRDGSGEITLAEFRDGLSQLGSFSKLSNREFKALCKKFNNDGDSKVSLFEFMTFMGKKYDPVESATKKLKAILLKAEEMGTSLSKAFAQFDTDGSGEITLTEFTEGLSSLGVFKDLTESQVAEVMKGFDKDKNGIVSLTEFMRFVGKDYVADVESKLRKILAKAVTMGTTIEGCFSHFDSDGDGKINAADMQTGMKSLGQFEQVGAAEAQELIRRFDDDNDGCITQSEFISAFGSSNVTKKGKKKTTTPAEKKVVDLFVKAEKAGASLSSLFASLGGKTLELTYKDFGDAIKKLGKGFDKLSSVEIDELCEGFDADKSMKISLGEFETFIRKKQEEIKRDSTAKATEEEDARNTAEQTILAAYGLCSHFSGEQRLSDFANGRESISYAAWRRGLGDMVASADFLKPLDVDLNGQECQAILRGDFNDPSAKGEGEIGVKIFEDWFEDTTKGSRNQDKQHKREVALLARLIISNALELGETDEVGLEEGLSIMAGADVRLRGKGVGKLFASYGKKAGRSDVKQFISVLVKLVSDCSIRATEGELKSLVKRMDRGSTEVDCSQFFEWLCNGARAGEEEGKEGDDDEEDEEGKADDGDGKENVSGMDDPVENQYKFSTDPETRDAEKKIRRASRKIVQSGGVDLVELFGRYDTNNDGTIVRSDFIQILMELGLCLLDSGAGGGREMDPVKKRQMATLAAHRGGSGRRAAKLREKRPQLFSKRTKDGEEDAFNDEREALNLIKWYRDGQKKTIVRDLLAQSLTTKYTLTPRFGHTVFFEYSLKNPFGQEERFTIDFKDSEVRVVTSSEEWMYLRRRVPPAVGSVGEWPIEHDMIDGDETNGFMITLQPHETVSIPFTMLSLERGSEGEVGERVTNVSFVSSTYGHTTSVLELHIKPKAMIVDRSFRFFQVEGEILKRTVQLLGDSKSLDYHDYESEGVGSQKYVHCVEMNSNRVVVDWRGGVGASGGVQEVLIKYRCGKFPTLGEFYILIYEDHFQGVVHECWHVVVQSRLRLDVHAPVGQSTPSDLVIQGDKFARRVQVYSSSPVETAFDPSRPFQLVPGAFNRATVRFKMRKAGTHKVHVHMVDLDTKELVCAWLVTVNSDLPVITKVYDVQITMGCPSSKKLSFTNQWDKPRRYKLMSSDESVMRPRTETVDIDPRAVGHMRLLFHPIDVVGTTEVILFVNDEQDQNEEAFLLKLHVGG